MLDAAYRDKRPDLSLRDKYTLTVRKLQLQSPHQTVEQGVTSGLRRLDVYPPAKVS